MTDKLLPNNDPDLQLARRIGASLENGRALQSSGNNLLESLLLYKKERKQLESGTLDSDGSEMWDQIARETNFDSNTHTVHRLESTRNTLIWAAAATLLIAAFLGIFYYRSLQPDMLASTDQQIQTLTLEDGSSVTLRPHSSLYLLPGNDRAQNYRLNGEAYFEVVNNPDRTFSVEAGNAIISVLGTKFDLSTWGSQTQVFLEEGSIRFENKTTSEAVILSEGESAETREGNAISTATSDISEFTDWMNKELIFRDKTARYVFSELEQEFDFTISAPESVMQTRLSGGLSLENPQQSLEDLSLVLGGTFSRESEKRYRFVPEE